MTMANTDPIHLLKDIHGGAPIGVWPFSPFVWLLFIGLLAVILVGVWLFIQRLKRARPRRLALSMLNEVGRLYAAPQHHHTFVQETNIILKRYMKSISHEPDATTLFGEPWLEFLEKKGPGLIFKTGPGQVLASGGYDPQVKVEVDHLLALLRLWLKRSSQ